MSTPERGKNTPPTGRTFHDLGATNSSNARFDSVPERLEMNPPQNVDSIPKPPPGKDKNPPTGGSKLLAASALTSLVKPASAAAGLSPKSEHGEQDDGEFVIPQRFTKSGRRKATPFPLKLMKVLSTKEYQDIINWLPNGKAFTVFRPKAFVNEVLHKEFKQAKFSSFTRKLHRWGFQRHLRGPESGAFFHEMFLRDRPDLVEQMTCHPGKAADVIPHTHPGGMALAQSSALREPMGGYHFGNPLLSQHFAGSVAAGLPMQSQHTDFRQPTDYLTELRRQQQHQQQMHQQQLLHARATAGSLPLGGGESAVVMPNSGMSPDRPNWNAAIEAEVSRRLRERVHAASMSRQALAAMQQQQHVPRQPMSPPMQSWNAGGVPPSVAAGRHMAYNYPMVNPSRSSHAALREATQRSMGVRMSPSLPGARRRSGSAGSGGRYEGELQQSGEFEGRSEDV